MSKPLSKPMSKPISKFSLETIIDIVERKRVIDQQSTWSNGSATYLLELKKELEELEAEIGCDKQVFLEDELADVLWDYLNLVDCLSIEEGVSIEGVLSRTAKKYEERIAGVEQGRTWQDTKNEQKVKLQAEHLANKKK